MVNPRQRLGGENPASAASVGDATLFPGGLQSASSAGRQTVGDTTTGHMSLRSMYPAMR